MAEVMEKHAGGRPSKYDESFNKLAFNYCLLGATDKDLAKYFDTSEVTVNKWKEEHPEFLKSIKMGKEEADAKVASRLFKKATGYEREEDKIFQFQGQPVVVPTEVHYQPDTTAAIFWLKNRQPAKWRDTQNIEVSGLNGGPIALQSLNTLQYEDLLKLEEIMAKAQISGEVVDIEPNEG